MPLMMPSTRWRQTRAAPPYAAGPSATDCGASLVRDRTSDWLIIWERDPAADNLVVVRYLGADPFA